MSYRDVDNGRKRVSLRDGASGYSLIEILVVLALTAVMTAISLPYMFSYTKKYRSEMQAIQVMDLMREAGDEARDRIRTIRLEINGNVIADKPAVVMIDEMGTPLNFADDVVIKMVPLEPLSKLRMDRAPTGMPLPPLNYPAVVYTSNVWTLRFTPSDQVLNAAGTAPVNATLYSWRPIMDEDTPYDQNNLTPARPEEVRAVTINGGSGAVRYWKWTGTSWVQSQ
jgi:prepilin-type N-terminal cleavage/methylation domain-containing protein